MEAKKTNYKPRVNKLKASAVAIFCLLALFCALLLFSAPATSASAWVSPDGLQWLDGATPKQLTGYSGFLGGGRTDALPTFDGGKMPIGHDGSDFSLGFDENGNFAVERSAGSGAAPGDYGAFCVSPRVKTYADGFSTTFRFDPTPIERGAPEAGGTFAIGLGNETDLNGFFNIVFRYNGTDLDMYLILVNMAHGYNVDGDGAVSLYNKANLVEISTLATRAFAKPKLGEKITLQLKNVTKAEADAYNADSATTKDVVVDEGTDSCWRWSVNGVILETPGFKGPVFDALSLPKDEKGDYYGYLWADCNKKSSWEMLNASNLATGAGGAYVKANLSGRLTFYDIVYDGSAGGLPIKNSETVLPGTGQGAAAGDFSYAVNPTGAYKGKTTLSSNGTYSLQYTEKAKLNAFETNFALKKIDWPNGGSYRILFKKTAAVGTWTDGAYGNTDPYFGLVLTKTAWRGMAVTLLINGTEYPTEYTAASPYAYDFKNGGEINVQLFYAEGTAFLLFNGNDLKCHSEIGAALNSFEKDGSNHPEGYIYLQNDSGPSRATMIDMITDGSAVQKPIVIRVEMPSDKTLAYGDTAYKNPETVSVFFSDGTNDEWNVVWSNVPNTKSAQTYTITGTFENLDTLKESYLIPSEIADLKFKVTVQLDPAFIKSENLGTGYDKATDKATIGAEGYRWYSVYSVQIPYLYKQDSGYEESVTDNNKYEHLMSDPARANRQFHTSDLVRKDVDGYEVEFSVTNHSPEIDPDVFIMLTASPGHPEQIGQGNVGIRMIPLEGQTKMHPQIITWMNGATGGLPDGAAVQVDAYFQKGDETPVHNIGFDYTGKTMYRLKWSLSGEKGSRKVDMTLVLSDGTEYAIVDADGNHIDKADYQFNGAEPTILAPNGQFVNEKGYLFFWVEKGYNEITFRQHYKEYGASYTVPEDKTIANGTALEDLGLPSSVGVKTNKNRELTGSVVYSGYDPAVLGTQSVTGTVALPQGVEFEDNLPEAFTLDVTVMGMITAIGSPQGDIKIKEGGNANLPTKFTATLNGGATAEIAFIWIGDYDSLTQGEYTLTATPLGYYEYAEGTAPMTVKITVEKATGCNSSVSATLPAAFLFVFVAALAFMCLAKKKSRLSK